MLYVIHSAPGRQRSMLALRCHPMNFSGNSIPHSYIGMRIGIRSMMLFSISILIHALPKSMAIVSLPASIFCGKSGGSARHGNFRWIPSPIFRSTISPLTPPRTHRFRALPFRAAAIKLITPPALIMKSNFLMHSSMPYLKRHTRKDGRIAREKNDLNRQDRQKVYHSARWRRLANAYLAAHPLCEMCAQKGIQKLAVDVHHRVSFTRFTGLERMEMAYNPNNLMALCKECHAEIHLHQRRHEGEENI